MAQPVENHPEWDKENSLTAPADRDREIRWRPEQSAPALTDAETESAMADLNNETFVQKFPRFDKTYSDPAIPLQVIGLISFTPAKGAVPNKDGVYGFAKLRGNYATPIEANQRAEYIIRNIDSYHQIYHTYVGRPFPITASSKYSAETEEIDIRKQMTESISQNIKDKKGEEQRIASEIKEREEKLLEESKRSEVDPYDEYITLRVKKAQLSWTYLEHQKKMAEVKDVIIKTRALIEEMDKDYPEFDKTYYDKYMKAREEAGIKHNEKEALDSFIKYLVEDADLGF